MAIKDSLMQEWEHEIISTRRLLQAVPFEKADWKPHEKSMTLKRLATHVAEIPNWLTVTLATDELDFSHGYTAHNPASKEELLAIFEKCAAESTEQLKIATDENFRKDWTLRNAETIYFTMPKTAVARSFVMNHLYHHRGQLTVYLRLLEVPVPGLYGPSADEKM